MARRGVTHNEPRDNSATVTRFFKVMFGNNHKNVLYLPPKFARQVRHLVGQNTEIEDSDGNRWPVTCSYVDGSLALQKGWGEFFVDHGLKTGHFVLFNYVNETHFVVNIFDESAMEITDFKYVDSRCNKRLRPNPEIISVNDPSQPTDESLPGKPSSDDSVASRLELRDFQTPSNVKAGPICSTMDDPSLMIDRRDNGCFSQGDGINILYDLSCFEIEKKIGDLNEYEKPHFVTEQVNKHPNDIEMSEVNRQPNNVDKSEKTLGKMTIKTCRTDNTKVNDICVEKLDKVPENIVSASCPIKLEQVKMDVIHEKSSVDIASGKRMEQIMLKGGDTQTAAIRLEKINSHFGNISTDKLRVKPSISNINLRKGEQDVISGFRNALGNNKLSASGIESLSVNHNKSNERRDYALKLRCRESSVSSAVPKSPFGQVVVKKEQVELRGKKNPEVPFGKSPINETRDVKMVLAPVKVEPDLPCDIASSGAPSPFSTKVESQSYLELPVHIPSAAGRRARGNGKVIFLRDPNGRLFHVLYSGRFNIKALTGDWNRFYKGNGLKAGDECRFEAEDVNKCFYRVSITRSNGR